MNALIEKTTKSEQKVALSSIEFLAESENKAVKDNKKIVELRIQESGEVIPIPLKALSLLKSIISTMAQGKSIALIPSDSEISTQQAAEILNVSRPHVIKLLEKGEIPYHKVGSHRRIQLEDLLEYEAKFQKERRKQLDYLAKESQKLNLGYE